MTNRIYFRQYDDCFMAVDGTVWRVKIYGPEPKSVFADYHLTFPADSPAEIEWPATDKLEPLCPSALTLHLESDTDRRFAGLYSTAPCEYRAEVYRRDIESGGESLYWTGLLDTELYEEPYSYEKGYDVTLTFSDLGALKRLKWELSGCHVTLRTAIEACLVPLRSYARGLSADEAFEMPVRYYIGTRVHYGEGETDSGRPLIDDVLVNADRFYDSDGEPWTLSETLEALLRPFGLRAEQRAGTVYVYDLANIGMALRERIRWDGTDAVLGVDKVYNNVKVTFSPDVPGEGKLLDGSIDPDDAAFASSETYNVDVLPKTDTLGDGFGGIRNLPGFDFEHGPAASVSSDVKLGNAVHLFKIHAAYSGGDCAGALFAFRHKPAGRPEVTSPNGFGDTWEVMRTSPVYVPDLTKGGRGRNPHSDYRLCVTLDMLCDVLYNPFERSSESEEKALKAFDKTNFAFVPVRLRLLSSSDGGSFECLYHYENVKVLRKGEISTGGEWVPGDYDPGKDPTGESMWLAYYDNGDREKKTALGGWATNRHCISTYAGELPEIWSKRGNGEFIQPPPAAGWLELTVMGGVYPGVGHVWNPFDIPGIMPRPFTGVDGHPLRWLLYKDPRVELRDSSGRDLDDESTGDAEYSAWLLREAEEELEISTDIGSDDGGMPCARGVLLRRSDKSPVSLYTRAGVTDTAERLLIGTAYSQHASRHTTLRGTTGLHCDFRLFTDAASPGMEFMRTGSVERLREAEADTTLCELSPENYEGIEYE